MFIYLLVGITETNDALMIGSTKFIGFKIKIIVISFSLADVSDLRIDNSI